MTPIFLYVIFLYMNNEDKVYEIVKSAEFAIQKNALSQSIYSCTPTARKLIAMATSFLKKDNLTVSFTISEFLNVLSLKGGNQREIVKTAIKELDNLKIVLKDSIMAYESFSWFTRRGMDFEKNEIRLTFNSELAELLKNKRGHAKLDLNSIGKLQSFYAIRYYELAMSYRGFIGKEGNTEDEWFFEKTIDELRELFVLQEKYKVTSMFRINVIDNPIAELNAAKVGFNIKLTYKRKGKKLVSVIFNCKNEPYEIVSNQSDCTQHGTDTELLKKHFPKQFEKALEEELKQNEFEFIGNTELLRVYKEGKATEKLRYLLKELEKSKKE